ncbi:MAG: hypothetical protein KA403_01920 [Candidatus Omnitrophica bacterium]|nr:hypothetical protein [Candidatus Omnitrophota bacterium]
MTFSDITVTDKIIFFSAILLFWLGWSKGFLQTILGPIALIIGTLLSYFHYVIYHNIVVATAIGIVGPIILSIVFSMTLGVLLMGTGDKKNYSMLSRLCGAVINMCWGEFLIVTAILLVILIPLKIPVVQSAQADILQSITYVETKKLLSRVFEEHKETISAFDPSKITVLTDPKAIERVGETPEFKDLMQEPLVQDLLNDPDANRAIDQKNIGKLLQNPKFIKLTQNPALLQKFMSLYGTILKYDPSKTNTKTDTKTKPKSKEKASVKPSDS